MLECILNAVATFVSDNRIFFSVASLFTTVLLMGSAFAEFITKSKND